VFVGVSVDGYIARPNGELDFLDAGGVDGGITIQGFLRAGLVHRLVITRVPVLIGNGIPLFGTLPQDVSLRHIATRALGGLVQNEYEVSAV
jgi:dihydrofolate reductase